MECNQTFPATAAGAGSGRCPKTSADTALTKDALVGKLRLAERVEAAINAQDIARFHGMLNDLAAQHLSAIQVLGYVLGAIVGAIQLR